eukprot:m.307876 g.307876  ORF g.307876 m.307876 type:complete len:202 (+) comp42960_c0_seq1:106-711(+)
MQGENKEIQFSCQTFTPPVRVSNNTMFAKAVCLSFLLVIVVSVQASWIEGDIVDIIHRPLLKAIPKLSPEEKREIRAHLLSLLRHANSKYQLQAPEDDIAFLVEIIMLGDPNCIFCHTGNIQQRLDFLPPTVRTLLSKIREKVPVDGFYQLQKDEMNDRPNETRQRRFICGGLCIAAGAFLLGATSSIAFSVAADAAAKYF